MENNLSLYISFAALFVSVMTWFGNVYKEETRSLIAVFFLHVKLSFWWIYALLAVKLDENDGRAWIRREKAKKRIDSILEKWRQRHGYRDDLIARYEVPELLKRTSR